MRLEPADLQVAMEYAFLCYETKQQTQARRIFDRVRQTGNAVAEQAFHNIDDPLAAGISRWKEAIANGADNFSAHFELATLAEQRDELELAAEHYEKAWRIQPERRTVLVDLGRTWKSLNRLEDANAALLAASRGGEPRAAEMARELLSERYPYVSEFRRALELNRGNAELRRELAYLLLRMDRQPEAEQEFWVLTKTAPDDMLSATQLGFLLIARGDAAGAMPLFEHVLAGPDEDLANRVRAVLRIPQVLRPRTSSGDEPVSIDAKVMAERSIKAGYMKDAGTKQRATITASFGGGSASVSIVIERGNTWRQPPADKTAVKQVAMFGIGRSPFAPLIRSSFLNRARVYSASSHATRKNSQAYLKKQGNNRTLGSREFIGPHSDVAVPSCPL